MTQVWAKPFWWVIIGMMISLVGGSVEGQYSGGDGTEGAPYRIASVADWYSLLSHSSDWDMHFILINDIDFDGAELTPIAGDRDNTTNSYVGIPFRGVFDGQGKVLSNAVINVPSQWYVGLFAFLSDGAEVRNLIVRDIQVTGASCVGGLVGRNYNGTITHCSVSGVINGESYLGGLVGYNGDWEGPDGIVVNCHAACDVNGIGAVGGLVGQNCDRITGSHAARVACGSMNGIGGLVGLNDGMLEDCYATASAVGSHWVGGLVGLNHGSIVACYATGDVIANEYEPDVLFDNCSLGGLVGDNNNGTISRCYATGSVSNGIYYCGGLVGENDSDISQCYATGAVSGVAYVGGLVGYSLGPITACYAAGAVSGDENVGGLIGLRLGKTVAASFWDTQTSGTTRSSGGSGLSTIAMQAQSTFVSAGWDFADDDGDPALWKMPAEDYPCLHWQVIFSEADINSDGQVNLLDFALLTGAWHDTSCEACDWCGRCDIDRSGAVGLSDLVGLIQHWASNTM